MLIKFLAPSAFKSQRFFAPVTLMYEIDVDILYLCSKNENITMQHL